MKRRNFLKLLGSSSTILLTGCANDVINSLHLSNNKAVTISKLPYKDEILPPDFYIVKNGYVIDLNNKKYFDEEGDIEEVFNIKNNWYYLVHTPNTKIYKIKSLPKKELIKEFNAFLVQIFPMNTKIYIGTRFNNYSYAIFDNIFEFNGDTFNLINKNVEVYGEKDDSVFYLTTENAIDIRTSQAYSDDFLNNKLNISIDNLIGGIDDNLVFLFNEANLLTSLLHNNLGLGVYNTTTNKFYILFFGDNSTECQFLKYGHKLVLKLNLNNKNKYIYMNELIEIKGINKLFKPIEITIPHEYSSNENIYKYSLAQISLSAYGTKQIIF